MKRLIPLTLEMLAIAVIMFIMAHMFVAGLLNEIDIREEHARIHWRSR
jgi:hypothetical protein